MDNFSRQPQSGAQQSSFFAKYQIFERAIKWLVGLIELTEEEQQDAGICYPNHQYDE